MGCSDASAQLRHRVRQLEAFDRRIDVLRDAFKQRVVAGEDHELANTMRVMNELVWDAVRANKANNQVTLRATLLKLAKLTSGFDKG